jgi:thioredoxin 1
MKAAWKIGVVILLVAAVVGVFALKQGGRENTRAAATSPLPRLVDLGSDQCIPCKMMMPVLDQLKKEYAGRLSVEFLNVRENPEDGAKYGIKLIPTQVFLDAAGKELFRHEGFFS